ncbi:MAG: SWIM zinc finger family protein [Ilumatobacter sp.]|uniref:SWIM zinc finger family protein n=1 Tax=Ilumatobacter sp. TaxID=1967498 RepID=UPI0026367C8E|nr:SWIM zinc finger family protein [Ilumatobacter sp.]MDJ0770681.1 SWIM zinc finger family protein [Ilumatobacter sp.]
MAAEHVYRYRHASTLTIDRGLALATAGGRAEHPFFFRGFVERADQAAAALLAIAEVARTRYFDAGAAARMRDPVVTSNVSVLRFEAFSACNGVYARFDIDADGLDGELVDWGTTNVDVGDALRAALAGVRRHDPLRLSVGDDEVVVESLDGAVVERKVPLPERWLRGFAEAQIASADMLQVAELAAPAARRTLRDLPRQRTGNRAMFLQPAVGGIRLSRQAASGAASLVGPQRLSAFQRVLPFVESLTVTAPAPRRRIAMAGRTSSEDSLVPTAWTAHLRHARLTLVVSPELYRGFSGEGGVLDALVDADSELATALGDALAGQATLEPAALGSRHGCSEATVVTALRVLGATGRVGHDGATDAYFHRDLPFDRAPLDATQPRLLKARELVADNAVRRRDGAGADVIGEVVSDDTVYTVRQTADGATCTCAWFAKHRGERGPCAHVLAARLAAVRAT